MKGRKKDEKERKGREKEQKKDRKREEVLYIYIYT